MFQLVFFFKKKRKKKKKKEELKETEEIEKNVKTEIFRESKWKYFGNFFNKKEKEKEKEKEKCNDKNSCCKKFVITVDPNKFIQNNKNYSKSEDFISVKYKSKFVFFFIFLYI
jgi:hypothetical protein